MASSPTFPAKACIARPVEDFEYELEGRRQYQPIVTLDGKTEHQEVRSSQTALIIALLGTGLIVGVVLSAVWS